MSPGYERLAAARPNSRWAAAIAQSRCRLSTGHQQITEIAKALSRTV